MPKHPSEFSGGTTTAKAFPQPPLSTRTSTCAAKPTSSTSCSWWWLCYMTKRTCGQVLVLPSRRLVYPPADDDFAIGFTTPLLICQRKMTECYSKCLPTKSAVCRLFSCTYYENISIDVSRTVYVMLSNLWIWSKNVASSCCHYL